MKCLKCGTEITEDSAFCHMCGEKIPPAVLKCSCCGTELSEGSIYCCACGTKLGDAHESAAAAEKEYSGDTMTEKEFCRKFTSKSTHGFTVALAVFCFITVGAVATSMLFEHNLFYLVDIAVYLPLAFLLLFCVRKWIYSLVILCYCAVGNILTVMNGGMFSGILVIIFAIMVMINTYKLSRAFR